MRQVRPDGTVVDTLAPTHSTEDITSGSAWTAYTPTVTAAAGSFTSVSATGRYKQLGKIVFVEIKITITTNGTAATSVRATLPVTASGSFDYVLTGREIQTGGKMLQGQINPSTPTLTGIRNYDNTYPGADGYVLVVSGVYEAA